MMNHMPPKISVIIGVLNMKSGLQRALDSLLAQNYSALEIIVMDGQSTDGTLEVIKEYAPHIHYWCSEKDKGHIDACNKGLMHANGEFIFLLNADDEIANSLFQQVAETYKQYPSTEMISCGIKILHEDKPTLVIDSKEAINFTLDNVLFGLPLTNARFYHRSLFNKYGNFQATLADGSYYISNDREFLTRLALHQVQTSIIAEPLYIYHAHHNSLTFGKKNLIKIHHEHILLANKLLTDSSMPRKTTKLIKSWKTRQYLALIYFLAKEKKFKASLNMLKQFIFQNTGNIL